MKHVYGVNTNQPLLVGVVEVWVKCLETYLVVGFSKIPGTRISEEILNNARSLNSSFFARLKLATGR